MTAPRLLTVETLARHYGGGLFGVRPPERALDGVSLAMGDGEILGIVGESGCGKSTLARCVAALDRPTAGRVILGGASLHDLPARALRAHRRTVQMVFQDPQGSLDPRRTVGSSVAEPLHCLDARLHGAERTARVAAMLEAVGLAADAARLYPHQFSGGQRQRIAIARALITAPRLVVADEPTSALDLSIQAQVLNLILDLNRDRGTAFLFISHNIGAVGAVADRVAVMFRGRIVETGPAAGLLAAPLHPYAALLIAAEPRIDDLARPQAASAIGIPNEGTVATATPLDWSGGCAFRGRCPRADGRCAAEPPLLRSFPGGRKAACHHPHEETRRPPSSAGG